MMIPHSDKITKTSNATARALVQACREFDGNNTYGRIVRANRGEDNEEKMFVVYSYGTHYPMYIYHEPTGTWYENHTKYSRSTSKQRSQLHPLCYTKSLPTEAMQALESDGLVGLIQYMTDSRRVA